MRKRLLIIVLGIAFLGGITWLGTFVGDYVPSRPTSQVQTSQVGSYVVTLRVDPNPPSLTQPATLSIQLLQQTSRQPVAGVHVVIDGSMESMSMGTTEVIAQDLGKGMYTASMPFSMSGPWQIQILISIPNQPVLNAVFTVATQ